MVTHICQKAIFKHDHGPQAKVRKGCVFVMEIRSGEFILQVKILYGKNGIWIPVPEDCCTDKGCDFRTKEAEYHVAFEQSEAEGEIAYRMSFKASYDTCMKLLVSLPGEEDCFHVIPCNIYGDNHAEDVRIGEFPLLTEKHPEAAFCSPYWEFRADRAAMPLTALCCKRGVAAVSVDPYSDEKGREGGGFIRNGVFARLPDCFGVTLGYTNDPVTFLNRSVPVAATGDRGREACAEGRIYTVAGKGRTGIHDIVRREYEKVHVRPRYTRSLRQAAEAMLEAFCCLNYDPGTGEYTNRKCHPLTDMELKPWRNVVEIGWTGGAILAFPLVMSRYLLGDFAEKRLDQAMSGEEILDRIVAGYREESGFFNDLYASAGRPSEDLLNGWWTDYGLCRDCHCAYTQGSAVYYILKTVLFLKERGLPCRDTWITGCKRVLDTVVSLQREDGAFGYTYSAKERKVLDWEGFAGCWFVPSLVYLARLSGEASYVERAKKAHTYYRNYVLDLDCYGAPMDTWKAVDQEGNLSFLHGSRLLYEYTGEAVFLEDMKQSAGYEFLWRYGYPTRPEHPPVNAGWNACGGSVTSVSNPHIHPMGVLADEDLFFLGEVTGDDYYTQRALDSVAWMMQTLELYPHRTGYGCYGILSERWCPSDGLVTERYDNGEPYASWFSYNLWAAANVLEAVLHGMERADGECGGKLSNMDQYVQEGV